MAEKCKHTQTKFGDDRSFFHCVADRYTDCNPGSHGSISYVETCLGCGAIRNWNSNQGYAEHSSWERLPSKEGG